ncbi:MAG: heavy-metal-associated domain-containing protein [Luteolibacter sp.]
MNIFLTSIITLFTLCAFAQADDKKIYTEISEKKREEAALAELKSTPNAVMVYAKGMCCESCGIGVRKKLQKLDFVDTKRFNKGIALDPKTQLVTIALNKGASADGKAIHKAVQQAGYDAMKLYELSGGKLKSTSLDK